MDLDTQLRTALDQAASAVPGHPGAWEDNAGRVRRDRHRRTVVLSAAVVVATVGLAGAGLSLARSPRDRVEVQPATTPTRPPLYALARPSAYRHVHAPVRLGAVNAEGRVYDVVVFLGQPVTRNPTDRDLMACVAVADEHGVVGNLWADPCQGPARIQLNNDFIGQLTPLLQAGLPAQPCSYGPMGNFDAIMTSTLTVSVSATTSGGSTRALELVTGTENWPVRVFAGAPPAGEVFRHYRLQGGDGVTLADVPLGGPANGCVTPAPGG